MTMEDKYYTPDIAEFYVGFECEIYNANNEWYPIQFTIGHYVELAIDNKQSGLSADISGYRVKYLSQEDIESLGFVLSPIKKSTNTTTYNMRKGGHYYSLHIDTDHIVEIYYEPHFKPMVVTKAKNISELKKVLLQFSI